jgi:hypothetical protein
VPGVRQVVASGGVPAQRRNGRARSLLDAHPEGSAAFDYGRHGSVVFVRGSGNSAATVGTASGDI